MKRVVNQPSLVWIFGFGMLAACQKAPVIEAPVPVTTIPEQVVEDSQPEDVDESPVENTVESSEESNEQEADLDPSLEYADAVNNAVALLTGSDQVTQDGLKRLEQLQKQYPDVAEVQYNIGVAQLKLGNDRAAEQAFELTLEIDRKFSPAWVNLGILKERVGDYDGAIGLYEEGLQFSENDPKLTARKVSCLRKMGQMEVALEFAQTSLKKNANNVDAYSEVGAVYLEQGNLDKALFVLQQAISRMGGDNANLQSILGKVYFEQDKKPLAELAFSKALSLNPNLIEPAMYLAFIQIQNRAWEQAKGTLEKALSLEPTNASLLNSMGIVHRGLGEIDDAEKMYQDSYQYNPSNPEPLLNLAVLEADYRNDYVKAYTLLERYLDEGGTQDDLVNQWRSEFEKSEKDFLAEKKRQEMRELYKRRREESAKKRAEEEAREAAEEARQAEEAQNETQEEVIESEDTDTEPSEVDSESIEETDSQENDTNDADPVENEDTSDGNGWDSGTQEIDEQGVEGDSVDSTDTPNDSLEASVEDSEQEVDESVEEEPVEEEPVEESTEDSDSPEDNGWGSSDGDQIDDSVETENSVENDVQSDESSWGTDVESCNSTEDCTGDLVCSFENTCLSLDQEGTGQDGDVCSSDNECGAELSCTDDVCTVDSE